MDQHNALATPLEAPNPGGRWMAIALVWTLLASTCCVLPLVLVLVGVTGAWMAGLAALKPVTPLFIALAVGSLAWAGYLVFRPQRACATADGVACATTRPAMRKLFVACAVFVAALLSFPLFAPLFY